VVRTGVQGDFWAWIKGEIADWAKLEMEALCSPTGPDDPQINYRRGKIRAIHDILALPNQFLAEYDYDRTLSLEDNPHGGQPPIG